MRKALKIFCYFGAILFLFSNVAGADSAKGRVRYLNVISDKNIVVEGGPYVEYYWVETDGTQGEIVLEFNNHFGNNISAKSASLFLNVADVKDAESRDGCSIVYKGNVIGEISEGIRNHWYEIPLMKFTPPQGKFTLKVKARGTDGLALYSKASAFGAVLKIQY